jgi:ketose-bisphosphate aldolase
MLVPASSIIKKAYRQHGLIVAFNTLNAETTLAIAQAAAKVGVATLFEISEKTIDYLGMQTVFALVKAVANETAGKVPMAIHLDHGHSFEICTAAIAAGFSSVMIDGSALAFADNVTLTKRVVDYAHRRRVIVQGEVGALVAIHAGKRLRAARELETDPKQARDFVRLTGVDSLGVAVGTLHGPMKIFRKLPKIDFERLKEIHEQVKVPLVLHGGSGVPVADLKKARQFGVTIVNIDTELRLAYLSSLRWELKQQTKQYDPRVIFSPVVKALATVASIKLKQINS